MGTWLNKGKFQKGDIKYKCSSSWLHHSVCLCQDIEYIRAHYNIENFIYFSHHRYEEHAQIRHFVLKPSFQHFTKHLFKEVLRLAHKSCLHHRIYPPYHSQEVGAQGPSGPASLDPFQPLCMSAQIHFVISVMIPLQKIAIQTVVSCFTCWSGSFMNIK